MSQIYGESGVLVSPSPPAPPSQFCDGFDRNPGPPDDCIDQAPIETESFTQWVIDDRFPSGRPAWEAGGALFVDNVRPYEAMKLRVLNGVHSMLAYDGFPSGRRYVRDTVGPEGFTSPTERHFKAAAAQPCRYYPGSTFLTMRGSCCRVSQILLLRMDGTEKLPQQNFRAGA